MGDTYMQNRRTLTTGQMHGKQARQDNAIAIVMSSLCKEEEVSLTVSRASTYAYTRWKSRVLLNNRPGGRRQRQIC